MSEKRWTAEDEGRVVFDAIKQAHRGTNSDIGRVVAEEDRQKAEQEAELAEAREANEKAEAENRDLKAVKRYLESH